jgi:hypothetical protein
MNASSRVFGFILARFRARLFNRLRMAIDQEVSLTESKKEEAPPRGSDGALSPA